jgi:hypothetical protein
MPQQLNTPSGCEGGPHGRLPKRPGVPLVTPRVVQFLVTVPRPVPDRVGSVVRGGQVEALLLREKISLDQFRVMFRPGLAVARRGDLAKETLVMPTDDPNAQPMVSPRDLGV